ncbi:MAG: hypothetical protein K6E91_07655 [Butyrivibrio sp.]|nr:hypothetical protein [Butyrivibrio sp.]
MYRFERIGIDEKESIKKLFVGVFTDRTDKQAIGDEQDDYMAAVLNVHQSVRIIESSHEIQKDEEKGLKVVGAIYRIEDGTVEFDV